MNKLQEKKEAISQFSEITRHTFLSSCSPVRSHDSIKAKFNKVSVAEHTLPQIADEIYFFC